MSKKIKDIVESYSQDSSTKLYQKRVFIYVRVSTNKQAEEGYSIPQQIERLQKYCEAMGWVVVKIYTDDGYSGGDLERPAMEQMIKEIHQGHADIVLVDKLDRLSRSQFDTLYMIQKVFDPNNVGFVSRAESFDTSTPFGKAMVGILAVFAELERSRIKERMMDGKEGRAKEGKYKGGGNIPIGFDYDSESGKLIENTYESMQVKEAFELAAQRMPFDEIARTLNHKGYRHKYGIWKSQTFKTMFRNPDYLGYISHKGELYDGLHDAIISEDVFNKLQVIMDERDRNNEKYKPGKRYASPLGGMIWCGNCDAKYHWRTNGRNKDGSYRSYYICYSRAKSDKKLIKDPNCKNKTYRDRDLEKIIYTEIRKLKSNPDYIEQIQGSVDNSHKLELLNNRINQIETQLSKLMDLYSLDGIDLSSLKDKIKPLNAEKKSLESELEALEATQPQTPKEDILNLVNEFEEALANNDCYKVHDIIAEIINYITINGENVEIHWNF